MVHMEKLSSLLDLDSHIAIYSHEYSTERFHVCKVVDKSVANNETILENKYKAVPHRIKDDWGNPEELGQQHISGQK